MAHIRNESVFILHPSTQQAIQNACANADIDNVVAVYQYSNEDNHIFDIYDEDENYQFSIDTDGDIIFEK